MTMPDQGTPVGHRDVTTSNNAPTGHCHTAAASDVAGYGSSGITGPMFTGFMAPQTASHMAHQPVYSPMAGYAMQENGAAWMTAQQGMQTEQPAQINSIGLQQQQHHQQQQHQQPAGNRPAGLASSNWLSHFPSQIPAGPTTPSIASGPSYMLSPGYSANSSSLAGTPGTEQAFVQEQQFQSDTQQAMQIAQDQAMQLESSNGVAMQGNYGFMTNPDHQMMSMAAAINAQQQQMQAMMPQQTINGQQSALTSGPEPVPAWLASHSQSFYYPQFGYENARNPPMGYMQPMPVSANNSFSGAVQQPPAYISGIPDSGGVANIEHSLVQQPPQQQHTTSLSPSYPKPTGSFTRPMEDETPNEERRKYVRTNSSTGDAFASRSSSAKVHGFGNAPQMAATTTAADSSATQAHAQGWDSQNNSQVRPDYFSPGQDTNGFRKAEHLARLYDGTGSPLPKIPETPKHEPQALPVTSTEMQMSDAMSIVGESEAGDDIDAMCISPLRKRSLSVSVSAVCSDDWNETVKIATATETLPKSLATVPENSRLESDMADVPPISITKKREAPAKPKETSVPTPAVTPKSTPPPSQTSAAKTPSEPQRPSTGKQEMQFIHMDAAEILMSSHSLFPDDHESGAPIKPVKFRPAGNAPIKVRKWATVVHPPPPESGYGSMPREVDFDHSASNVFFQHQAPAVAPSSVTSKFKAAPSSGKPKTSKDGSEAPQMKPVRTLNWRPSDDRISTAAAGLPPKTASKTTKTARLEEKKKAAAAEEAKAAKSVDTDSPDAEADADADEPMSVAKALAALSSKRGRPALTSRVARTKQVRKRTEESGSKPDPKAAKNAQDTKMTGNMASAT